MNNNSIIIYHHLGLGDHIICNGMVRHVKKDYKTAYLFCHAHYEKNIQYMYRDDPGIKIIPTKKETDVHSYLSSTQNRYIKIGFDNLPIYEHNFKEIGKTFDEAFYSLANLDFKLRFDNFYIQRDEASENEALEYLNHDGEEYIYIHDDPDRGFQIDPKKHRSDLKIIKNDFKFNLFQFRKILENATEIHTMQTGMFDFCNSILLDKPKIYVHKYVRNCSDFMLSKGINKINMVI